MPAGDPVALLLAGSYPDPETGELLAAESRAVVIEDSLCSLGPDANSDGWADTTTFCGGGDHFDGIQSDGGNQVVLRHNTIRNPCSQTSNILLSSNT